MYLHAPKPTETRRVVVRCPGRACRGRLKRVWCEFVEWYGWRFTCCSCGCGWQDDEVTRLSGRLSAQRASKQWHNFRKKDQDDSQALGA